MIPDPARDIFLYYAAALAVGVIFFLWRRPDRQMRLRLRIARRNAANIGSRKASNIVSIENRNERPLNVIFQYNAESWDAYEVLGIPAGSSLEKVEQAYKSSLKTIDAESRAIVDAAYSAIQAQWNNIKATGSN